MTKFINEILTGDNVEIMRSMPDECVDLTVTSPPYDGLRTYNGYSFDFESVAAELYRITKQGGVVVWIVGDSTRNGSESGTSFRQALHFKDIGFRLHDTMIYAKDNPVPLTHNRYEQQFEYMFVLAKGKPSTFNPINEKTLHAGKKRSGTFRHGGAELSQKHKGGNISDYKRKANIWSYTVGKGNSTKDSIAFLHPAIFPEKLAEDHIVSWSNPGDLVFDPFGGSGTTAKMAALNSRSYLHVEISEEYNEIARKRLAELEAAK